jgi:hypothetical protein
LRWDRANAISEALAQRRMQQQYDRQLLNNYLIQNSSHPIMVPAPRPYQPPPQVPSAMPGSLSNYPY